MPCTPYNQVGDIDTEMLLWYRPEEQALPRPAFTVDLSTGGSDLGGSVAAALAAASLVFRSRNESEYAAQLLAKAQEVGGGYFWVRSLSAVIGRWWQPLHRQQQALGSAPAAKHGAQGNAAPWPPPLLQVYEFAAAVKGRFGDGDFNLTLLYNSSTLYDDLAWAAGWLYKATKQVGLFRGRVLRGLRLGAGRRRAGALLHRHRVSLAAPQAG